MRLCVSTHSYELHQIVFALPKSFIGQPTSEQFVPQPNTECVEPIAFAVIGNLSYSSFAIIFFNIRSADAIGFTGQSHLAFGEAFDRRRGNSENSKANSRNQWIRYA